MILMRTFLKEPYILVAWPTLVRFWGRITTGTSEAKGLAIFPFIFVFDVATAPQWLIQHERIHFRQQLETLFIGLVLLSFLERLYGRFWLKMDKMQRYLYAASEQEAYLYMRETDYLERRPFGAIWHYVVHKQRFQLVGPGELEFLDGDSKV